MSEAGNVFAMLFFLVSDIANRGGAAMSQSVVLLKITLQFQQKKFIFGI